MKSKIRLFNLLFAFVVVLIVSGCGVEQDPFADIPSDPNFENETGADYTKEEMYDFIVGACLENYEKSRNEEVRSIDSFTLKYAFADKVTENMAAYLEDLLNRTNVDFGYSKEEIIQDVVKNLGSINAVADYIDGQKFNSAFDEMSSISRAYRGNFTAKMLDDVYHEQLTVGCEQLMDRNFIGDMDWFNRIKDYIISMNDGTYEKYKKQLDETYARIRKAESEKAKTTQSPGASKSNESWEDKSWDEMTEAERAKAKEWADDYIKEQIKENPDAYTGW